MKTRINRALFKIKQFNKIAEIDEIARRYLAMNSFDGVLAILGILLASFFADIQSRSTVITASLGIAVAIAVSGFYGTFITEKAERTRKIKKLEKSVGMFLKESQIQSAHSFATFALAAIDGLSPFLIAIIIIMPFFITSSMALAYYLSFALAVLFLFLVGAFLGTISKENVFKEGMKMIAAGIVCTIIIFFVEKFAGV
ncbi:MAG: VIT1/CCC1 transporter family protein [Candidatus Woesearchaeota archaeon]|nr:VIT1/CCC1 transporter family protein [Candidatus Woesearchaeota archaeon]